MMLIVLVLALIILAVWYFEPTFLAKESRDQATSAVATSAQQTYSQVKGWMGQVRLPFQKDTALAAQFKQWISQADLSKRSAVYKGLPSEAAEFAAWIEGLSPQALAQFVYDLSAICRAQGFELAWLVDPTTPDNLKRAVEDAVVLQSLAAWKARNLQPLLAYKAWRAAPSKAENQAFARRLFTKLVEAGLASAPSELILAPDKEREAYVIQAINSAANEHEVTFLALVQEVTNELESEKKKPKKKAKKQASAAPSATGPTPVPSEISA